MKRASQTATPSSLRPLILAAAAMVMLFLVAGCMGGRVLTIAVGYDTERDTKEVYEGQPRPRVVLIPFERGAGVQDHFGKWVGFGGRSDVLVSSDPVEESITNAVYAYLKDAKVEVNYAPKGATVQDYKSPPPDLVMRGVVDELATSAVSRFGSTSIKTELRIRVFLTNTRDGSTLNIRVFSSSKPRTVVTIDPDIFARSVNEVVSDSVEQIFKNTTLKDGIVLPQTK